MGERLLAALQVSRFHQALQLRQPRHVLPTEAKSLQTGTPSRFDSRATSNHQHAVRSAREGLESCVGCTACLTDLGPILRRVAALEFSPAFQRREKRKILIVSRFAGGRNPALKCRSKLNRRYAPKKKSNSTMPSRVWPVSRP